MAAPYAEYISSLPRQEVKDVLKELRHPVDIALHSVNNYFNFGACIRTGHNFLVRNYHGIELETYYPKAAMTVGKFEQDQINYHSTIDQFLDKTQGRNIVSFERRTTLNTQDIRTFDYPENPILLFGSEKEGVPDRLIEASHSIVSIPVFGFNLDYNVSVACGIVLYDFISKLYRKK